MCHRGLFSFFVVGYSTGGPIKIGNACSLILESTIVLFFWSFPPSCLLCSLFLEFLFVIHWTLWVLKLSVSFCHLFSFFGELFYFILQTFHWNFISPITFLIFKNSWLSPTCFLTVAPCFWLISLSLLLSTFWSFLLLIIWLLHSSILSSCLSLFHDSGFHQISGDLWPFVFESEA